MDAAPHVGTGGGKIGYDSNLLAATRRLYLPPTCAPQRLVYGWFTGLVHKPPPVNPSTRARPRQRLRSGSSPGGAMGRPTDALIAEFLDARPPAY